MGGFVAKRSECMKRQVGIVPACCGWVSREGGWGRAASGGDKFLGMGACEHSGQLCYKRIQPKQLFIETHSEPVVDASPSLPHATLVSSPPTKIQYSEVRFQYSKVRFQYGKVRFQYSKVP